MVFPCKIKSMNGYDISYIPNNTKTNKDIRGTLSLSMMGMDSKNFIFVGQDKLRIFYNCLLTIFKSINKKENNVRTIELPSIKLDEYIGVFMNSNGNCLITLKSKHITTRDDTYKTTDTFEIILDELHVLLYVIGRSLYDESWEDD